MARELPLGVDFLTSDGRMVFGGNLSEDEMYCYLKRDFDGKLVKVVLDPNHPEGHREKIIEAAKELLNDAATRQG